MLTLEKFKQKIEKISSTSEVYNKEYWDKTYIYRWEYINIVLEEVKKIDHKTAIEIGTAGISLLEYSDSIDIKEEYIDIDNIANKKYIFDATKTPWSNIKDKSYDLFLGLQVLEHLGPNQQDVFKEIKRISKYAILTLPYKWICKDITDCHHMIDDYIINKWTNNEVPYKKDICVNKYKRDRIMLCYKF